MKFITMILTSLITGTVMADRVNQPIGQEKDEVLIGPVIVKKTGIEQKIDLEIPVSVYVRTGTANDSLHLHLRVVADLGDLQAKFGPIIDAAPLPRDKCASYSTNNPVVFAWGKTLTVSGSAVVATVQGNVDFYDCRENPISPHHILWDKWVARQPASVSITGVLRTAADGKVSLDLSKPDVTLGASSPLLAHLRDVVLHIFGVDIQSKADAALRKAIDPSILQATVPELLPGVRPTVSNLTFADLGGGKLGLRGEADLMLTGSEMTALLKQLAEKGTAGPK